MPGPLAGVRVLELGSFIAGPFAGQLLGDYGADVIKIEPPGDGDPMRRWGVTRDGDSLWWPAIGRNKRSVALDLRQERARALVAELAADVRRRAGELPPRPPRRVGPRLRRAGGRATRALVMVHISGFGQTGPLAGQAGFGSVGEAMGGIRHTTGSPDRPPSRAGISLGDALASVFGVVGHAVGAGRRRARTGVGQEVDVAIYEAVAALMESTMADYELGRRRRARASGSVLPGVAPSNVYPTSDGAEVVVAANADARVRPAVQGDGPARAGRRRALRAPTAPAATNMAELDELVGGVDGRRCRATRCSPCSTSTACRPGASSRRPDMLTDPQYLAREMVQRVTSAQGWEVPMTGVVPRFTATPGAIRHAGAAPRRAHRRGARRAARPRRRTSSTSCTPPA